MVMKTKNGKKLLTKNGALSLENESQARLARALVQALALNDCGGEAEIVENEDGIWIAVKPERADLFDAREHLVAATITRIVAIIFEGGVDVPDEIVARLEEEAKRECEVATA